MAKKEKTEKKEQTLPPQQQDRPGQRRRTGSDLDASDPRIVPAEKVKSFGSDVPLGRPGQPEEVAPCFVFLASDESSFMTGQVLHPNGGEVVNG